MKIRYEDITILIRVFIVGIDVLVAFTHYLRAKPSVAEVQEDSIENQPVTASM